MRLPNDAVVGSVAAVGGVGGVGAPSSESDPRVLHRRRGGPTALRILLGSQLRRLREDKRISTEDAAWVIRGSHSKISRMELGRVGFKERDVADLLTLYGVTDPADRDGLLELAREANSPGWWHHYGDVLPSWFETYLGLEEAAALVRTYDVHCVPELLQSEGYAGAVLRLQHPDASEADLRRRVRVRMTRQERFARPGAPVLWALIDEAVLRRPVGGRDVMRDQLRHLVAMADVPTVTVQIVPFAARRPVLASPPFTVLRFAEADLPDVVYLEHLTTALYLDRGPDVEAYLGRVEQLADVALPPDLTVRFLLELLHAV
ncbi:XRE family transcriptional regulator [Actinomadura logoneensis]|uniref:XRE family transcriptional regulator n=2 Tax=Actinomadura logoneensis TaxID=2293572 RepID=A0A372JFT3_9ACTN|nr:XRE family transcriptional regulator [Actinomadura logoneensis]